jgi:hypothetical protein
LRCHHMLLYYASFHSCLFLVSICKSDIPHSRMYRPSIPSIPLFRNGASSRPPILVIISLRLLVVAFPIGVTCTTVLVSGTKFQG